MADKIKSIIAVLLIVIITITSMPLVSMAATEYIDGNFTYTVSSSKATIVSYPETAEGIVNIPSTLGGYTVTAIGDYAFYGCTLITEIYIPKSITSIGTYAFGYCIYLEKVHYEGTEEQWKKISIGSGNRDLTDASIHYQSTGSESDVITGELRFASGSSWNEVDNYHYSYTDDFFYYDSSKYHHDLALMSLVLEASSCVPDGAWDGETRLDDSSDDYSRKRPLNAEILFEKIGFNKYCESYGYQKAPEFDSVANVIAAKNIDDKTTVIAVAVRGVGYEAEWGGNFNMGKSEKNHKGFDTAKNTVLKNIENFVNTYGDSFKSNVKIWITGYSRGAAIANLVAAAFDDGIGSGYPRTSSLGITKDNLYCYCFETPLNTTDKNANSSKYNNIFSIANPIDIVTKVAPQSEGFNFNRYGKTYYLPTVETISKYNEIVKVGMSKKHKEIYGKNYEEDFAFYEFKVNGKWTWLGPDVEITISENKSIGQMTYANNLIEILATEGFKNRTHYYENMQGAVMKIMAAVMGGYQVLSEESFMDSLVDTMMDYFKERKFLNVNPVQILKEDLAVVISTFTQMTYSEAVSLLGQVDDLLFVIASHPNYTLTTAANAKLLFYPHYPSVLVSWMAYLETLPESVRSQLLSPSLKYRTVKVNCPVDVNVFDSNGNLVASIINDTVVPVGGNQLSTYVDEDGQKCVVMPNDDEYNIQIKAREHCEVTCSIIEENGETFEEEKIVNYYEIPMNSDETIVCTAEDKTEVVECIYPIIDEKGKKIEVNEVLYGSEIKTYTVSAESNVDGIVVFGGGQFTVGEFSQVSAYDVEGYRFNGWYADDKLVSKEYQYRFCVRDNVSMIAKYEKYSYPEIKYSFFIQTPSRDKIQNKDGIVLHANIEGTTPDGSYIEWTSSNKNFSIKERKENTVTVVAENKGWTTFTAILYDSNGNELARDSVELYSKSGFFDKIGGFFRSIFGGTTIYDK